MSRFLPRDLAEDGSLHVKVEGLKLCFANRLFAEASNSKRIDFAPLGLDAS